MVVDFGQVFRVIMEHFVFRFREKLGIFVIAFV